ncbi:DUF6944 family repetitive protein [Peribacillus sp. NPDC097675]|uniref:DUF6944 family repetitive protein n=1 Tax=Peribacillus sp. NPDC097675 TaxID=3390618 RepID=UPI003D0696B2
MSNEFKETFGSWVQAIGTVLSAIANTPTFVSDEHSSTNLDVVGNVLQGTGNAVIADGEEAFTLEQIGSAVQAVGNSSVVMGLISDFSQDTKDRLIINGNFIQAVGGGVSAADITENAPDQALNIVGNLLQAVGNSLQALATIIDLNSVDQNESFESFGGQVGSDGLDEESIQVLGSWIQAIGSILTLIAQLKSNQSDESDESEDDNES